MSNEYEYYSTWYQYAYPEEERRFLTIDDMKSNLCECVRFTTNSTCGTKSKVFREGGGIPIIADKHEMYVLKDGHTCVSATSGFMKTRTVVIPAIAANALMGKSMVVNDVKGEIADNNKIIEFVKSQGYKVVVLDFRTYKAGTFNFFDYPLQLIKAGKMSKASQYINAFSSLLIEKKSTNDDFWNDSATLLISSLSYLLLVAVAQKNNSEEYANLSSVVGFINEDKDINKEIFDIICNQMEKKLYNPGGILLNIYSNPERTFACIISTALSLLKDWTCNQDLSKMLSSSSFSPQELYSKKMLIDIVIPDETSAMDRIGAFLVQNIYQQLVEFYSEQYQNRKSPLHDIAFILDEFANVKLNEISAMVSAGRSRHINFCLIYQSDRQLEKAYPDDYVTIKSNCINQLFLGSSDFEVLKQIQDSIGTTKVTDSGEEEPIVSVSDLRRMKKTKEAKEALLIRGNDLYCCKLLDYEMYPFFNKYLNKKAFHKNETELVKAKIYTPEMMITDISRGIVDFSR